MNIDDLFRMVNGVPMTPKLPLVVHVVLAGVATAAMFTATWWLLNTGLPWLFRMAAG